MKSFTNELLNHLSLLLGEKVPKGRMRGGCTLIPDYLIHNSRNLRKSSTPHEQKLWYHLRNRRLEGFRFTRQSVIGPYIVDFLCHEKMLIIELDGGQHSQLDEQNLDKTRTTYLNSKGYTVLRFWNSDVVSNIQSIIDEIYKSLVSVTASSPHPGPLLKERGIQT